jgi:hypothetical protein
VIREFWRTQLAPFIFCVAIIPTTALVAVVGILWIALAASVRYGVEKLGDWIRDRA